MKLFALPESTLNKTLTYLSLKPFAEVTDIIASIQKAQLVVNNDGTPVEVSDETPATATDLPAETAPVEAQSTDEASATA